MNLNKGCIEIEERPQDRPSCPGMNLNKGCIEIVLDSMEEAKKWDEP